MNETERQQMRKEIAVRQATFDDASAACCAALKALPASYHAAIKAAEAVEAATIKAAETSRNAVFRRHAGDAADDAARDAYTAAYRAAKAAKAAAEAAAIDKCPGGAAYKSLLAVGIEALRALSDAQSKFNACDDRPRVRLYDASNPRNEVGIFRIG